MADSQDFWAFREGEEPLLRLIRTVVACSMGFKPPKPFGVCSYCPARRACHAVTLGRVAAAKHRIEMVKQNGKE